MAAAALRAGDVDEVVAAVVRYASRHQVPAEVIDPVEADGKSSTDLWLPRDGWIVTIWPTWFTGLGAVAKWLSGEFGTLVSTVDVYDGDFWNHVLWRDGKELDRFSSWPDHFTNDRSEAKRLKQDWTGRPHLLAETFGVPESSITPYLIPPYSSGIFGWWMRSRKPFPDDAVELADIWIFIDFWRRLGIPYPGDGPADRAVRFTGPGPGGLPVGGPSF